MIEIFREKIGQIGRFTLAVSGGADSICMTLLSYQLNLKPIVMIVDHKLRKESSQEALFVSEYVQDKFNFETRILTWNDHSDMKNIQASARNARYNLLTNESEALGIEYLLTAHNKNDQAETILMNIMRGSGVDGLVGMKTISKVNGINLLRPMLSFSRDEIIEYLRSNDINWVEDPSNNNEKFERVKVRKILNSIQDSNLVNSQNLLDRLVLLGENCLRTRNFIEKYVENRINEICYFWPIGAVTIDIAQLILEEEEIIFRILKKIIRLVGKQNNYVRFEKIMRLYEGFLISYQQKSNFFVTLGGCMIWLSIKNKQQYLVISRENLRKNNKNMIDETELKLLKGFLLDHTNCGYTVIDSKLFGLAREMIKKINNSGRLLSSINNEYQSLGLRKMNKNFIS